MRSLRHSAQQALVYIFPFIFLWSSAANAAKRGADDMKLVCYYANWAIYRPGLAKFTPENINPYLCTHLIYAFAGMNKDYELKPFDSYNDIQQGNYKKFVNLKTYNPKLKLLIAVGGWNEGSKRFSKLVETGSSRLRFVRSAVSFLRKHGFDGLDLDWEYPGFRDGGQDEDKEGYAKLVTELREAFDSESVPRGKSKLLLTMAVPAGQQYIDKGYDVPVLSKHLDFFNLLTYDYHTAHEPLTNHHSALGETPGLEDWDPNRNLNVEWTVRYYIKKGADRRKLVVGVPTYGRSYTLADPDENEIGVPAEGPGEKGDATREKGYLAYYEICQLIQDEEWELESPLPEIMGPYAYKENQWVGFDDEDIIVKKAKFIVDEGLGGGMVWTLDNDDFRGKCYGEQSPLINTLKNALNDGDTTTTTSTKAARATTAAPPKRTTTTTIQRRQQKAKKPKFTTRATTTTIATPAPVVEFTTPDPGPPFACEDEGFFNNPVDCKKYFWCLDSGPSNLGLVAHAFTCPSGLFFNKLRDACDYASNVVCRVKKPAASATTTPKPKPRPRPRKTTTTTTTTTTESPVEDDLPEEVQNALSGNNLSGQNLMDLLELLQKLGVNQIHDKLHGRESVEATSTLSPTLPEYQTPNRRRVAEAQQPDLFNQYAKPDRTDSSSSSGGSTVRPRGPQFHSSKEAGDDEDERSSSSAKDPDDVVDFPFVYQTPSRHRATTSSAEEEDVPDEEEEEPEVVATTTHKPSPPKRMVVRVRPIPGESKSRERPRDIETTSKRTPRRNSNYIPAQTVGVRRVARPNILEEEPPVTTTSTTTTTRSPSTSKLPRRRARPVTRVPPRTTEPPLYYDEPLEPPALVVLPSGRPAVPATTRRYAPRAQDPREPALALLPDGRVTCLKRGVYPHPRHCAKFLVCVPAANSQDEFDGYIHDCPPDTYFLDDGARCMPASKESCTRG